MPYSQFKGKENTAYLDILNENGPTASKYRLDNTQNFWVWSSYIEGPLHNDPLPIVDEENNNYQDPELDPHEDIENSIFEDNEETCSASFTSFNRLLRHLNSGKHKKSLQLYKVKFKNSIKI